MMTSESKTANAIGGKTARACDSCLSKRARWFCPADGAFLCQSCDVSVHSANQLANRHERVRLETSSNKSTKLVDKTHQPAWHQGFTRKPRTPRNGKKAQIRQRKKDEENRVPEICSEENSPDENEFENEEQLLYRVPVFDPFEAELCNVPDETGSITDLDILLNTEDACDDLNLNLNLPEFLSSDIELAEFAADVETLLGSGEEEQSTRVEDNKAIKIEVEDEEMRAVVACHLDPELDMERETLNWNFDDYYEESVEQKAVAVTEFVASAEYSGNSSKADDKKRLFLRLNHEAVISAWPNQSSPWTNGIRPHFNPDDCWPDFSETCGGNQGYNGGHVRSSDGGREARVSRYREKRRTRLFSKKIRYEVRKLNAEKRPRLKGRFIKRTSSSFSAPGFPYLMNKR